MSEWWVKRGRGGERGGKRGKGKGGKKEENENEDAFSTIVERKRWNKKPWWYLDDVHVSVVQSSGTVNGDVKLPFKSRGMIINLEHNTTVYNTIRDNTTQHVSIQHNM